jgi:hypothetical protein
VGGQKWWWAEASGSVWAAPKSGCFASAEEQRRWQEWVLDSNVWTVPDSRWTAVRLEMCLTCQEQWLTTVILVTWEVDIGRPWFQVSLGKKTNEHTKTNTTGCGGVCL